MDALNSIVLDGKAILYSTNWGMFDHNWPMEIDGVNRGHEWITWGRSID